MHEDSIIDSLSEQVGALKIENRDLRAENKRLKKRVTEWALSLPEHPRWEWLRDEMLQEAK